MTNLTEQWKQRKLPDGLYYVKANGVINILDNYEAHLTEAEEVLAEVPSYEQWQRHRKVTAETQIKNCDLEIINTKLKELLKLNKVLDKGLKSILVWLKEETQGEQKKLCEQLYEDTLEMMSKIDDVLQESE